MPDRGLYRGAAAKGFATATNAPIRIDSSTNTPKYIPAGSGTTEIEIVDVSSTQTLTNKTFTTPVLTVKDGANFKIVNAADATKIVQWDLSTLTTGHTTTFQVPDVNGTDVIATIAASQTLTNKTISGGSASGVTLSGNLETDTKALAATATFQTNTVLASLTGLTQTLVAGKTYQFEVELFTTQTVNGGLQAAFAYSNSLTITSIQVSARQYAAASSAQTNFTTTTSASPIVNNKTAVYICTELIGTLVVGVGGNLDVQVAQNTSNSDTTSILLGSYGRFTRIN